MTWTLRQIIDQIAAQIQRSGARLLDSTYTVDALSGLHARQKTEDRLRDWIPDDLTGRRVIVIDCELGSVAFELARRGAHVTGLCSKQNEALICRAIADYLAVPAVRSGLTVDQHQRIGEAKFFWANMLAPWRWSSSPWFAEFDDVVCLDGNHPVMDTTMQTLRWICTDRVFYECGSRHSDGQELTIIRAMIDAGFTDVRHVADRYMARVG